MIREAQADSQEKFPFGDFITEVPSASGYNEVIKEKQGGQKDVCYQY